MVGVRAKDHDGKRQLILEKSAELFGRQGFHKTSIAEIAAACGASKAWLFHYFPNKEAILYTLLFDFLQMFKQRTDAALQEAKIPNERFRAFVRECFRIYDEYRINYPLLFNDMQFLTTQEQEVLRTMEREYVATFRGLLQSINPRLTDTCTLAPITLLAFGAVNWSYTWYDPDGPLPLEELVNLTERLLVDGLKSFA